MGLQLGIDFGTATLCAATLRDRVAWTPDVILLDGASPLVGSQVWIDRVEDGAVPLVQSRSPNDRSPLELFNRACECYSEYWIARLGARRSYASLLKWNDDNREAAMLLSYFKPELADSTQQQFQPVAFETGEASYDPMSQSTITGPSYTALRLVASPSPDTTDYVAATAALLRRVAEVAVRRYGEKLDSVVLGIPSLGASTSERKRAQARREEALALARIHEDFGTPGFRATFCGEAEAAALGLDMEAEVAEASAVIVDVGAGTTDLALMSYRRQAGTRMVVAGTLMSHSIRCAGRDINAAIASAILSQDVAMREAYRVMMEDRRSWQKVLDDWVERIKCALTSAEQEFSIRLRDFAEFPEGGPYEERQRNAISRSYSCHLAINDERIRKHLDFYFDSWQGEICEFLAQAERLLVMKGRPRVSVVELVGGALRFGPLRELLTSMLDLAAPHAMVRYRDTGNEAQTVVARGLARQAVLAPA